VTLPPSLINFVGYGHLAAPIWFLGMEEGFHAQQDEAHGLRARLAFPPTIGLAEGQRLLGLALDDPRRRLSQAWMFMARMVLAGSDDTAYADAARVRAYVRTELGSPTGATLLTEILPLPRPRASGWPATYEQWYASTREYEEAVRPLRTEMLRCLLQQHRPAAVVAYGRRNWLHYKMVVDATTAWAPLDGTDGRVQMASLGANRVAPAASVPRPGPVADC
jgi:hypothetical protein